MRNKSIIIILFIYLSIPAVCVAGGWGDALTGAINGAGQGIQQKNDQRDTQRLAQINQQNLDNFYNECLHSAPDLVPYNSFNYALSQWSNCYDAKQQAFIQSNPDSPAIWYLKHQITDSSDNHKATETERKHFTAILNIESECAGSVVNYAGTQNSFINKDINITKQEQKIKIALLKKYIRGAITRGNFWNNLKQELVSYPNRITQLYNDRKIAVDAVFDQQDKVCRAKIADIQNQQTQQEQQAKMQQMQAEIEQLKKGLDAARTDSLLNMYQPVGLR